MRHLGTLAGAAVFSAGAAGSVYAPGFVWDRSVDWTPGGADNDGYLLGNPDDDQNGGAAWAYEHVIGGGGLGDPDPWYERPPALQVWDSTWFGVPLQAWVAKDDVPPLIFRTTLSHLISDDFEFERAPLVRWVNPTGSGCTVRIAGNLTLRWSGVQNMETPVDVDVAIVVVTLGRDFNPVFTGRHADPSPGDEDAGSKKVPVDLSGVQVPLGGSLVIAVRGVKEVPGRWFEMDDNLTITLETIEGGCTPDMDGNGVLDLFDFLAFVNAFNAGC